MRGLLSSKTISSTGDKKSAIRIARQLPILASQIIFEKISQIIFPTDCIPISFEIETKDGAITEVSSNMDSVHAKMGNEQLSIPLNIGRQKWMRIQYGQECQRIVVRSGNRRRLEKKVIFSEYLRWKQQQKQQPSNCYTISLQPTILALRSKNEKIDRGSLIGSKNSLSSFIKTKFSERGTFKINNILSRRHQNESVQKQERPNELRHDNLPLQKQKSKKRSSQTLEFDGILHQELIHDRRQSGTSTSIRIEQGDIKFSKRIRRIKDFAEQKAILSQKQTPLTDTSQVFPSTKIRPRFYQHINLSQEQIDLKRKKFDSQFITKKSVFPTSTNLPQKQPTESEVTEDICKLQASKTPLEDTLERGLEERQLGAGAQQSGTLCESVYE